MDLLHAIILAAIQGVTEFLPISSSGHLVLPSILFGWADQGLAFDVAVHVGSLTAVMVYFRSDLQRLLKAWLAHIFGKGLEADARLAWQLILATIPACLFGLFFAGWIEVNARSIGVLIFTTVFYGLLLGWADKKHNPQQGLNDMSWTAALMIGLAQALALVPGTSRSGITITAALMMGYGREAAARFSFLMSIPIILAAGSLKAVELVQTKVAVDWLAIGVGTFIAALTAYACIHVFLSVISRLGMMPFVIYRLLLGAVLGILWLSST